MEIRRILLISAVAVLASSLLYAGCAPSASQAKPKRMLVSFGTSSAAGTYYLYGIALAKVWNESIPEMKVTVLETGGTHDNIRRLQEGEIGIASSMAYGGLYEVWTGAFTYQGKPPYKKIRMIPGYGAKQYAQVVRADSGVMKPEDLQGKPFNPGMAGGYAESMTKAVYSALGVAPDWKAGGTAEAVTNIKDRRWVGYSKPQAGFFDLDASTIDLMSASEIRMLHFTPEQVAKVKKVQPHIEWFTVPANSYRQLKKHPEITAFGSTSGSIVLDDMPAEITYKMVKAMGDNKAYLTTVLPALSDVEHGKSEIESLMGFQDSPPLATGFVWWAEEKGIKVPQRLIPPEYKARK